MKKTEDEILCELSSEGLAEKFMDIFSLRQLFVNAIYLDEGMFRKFTFNIPLTDSGTTLLQKLRTIEKYKLLNEQMIKWAIFLDFYQEEILVDINRFDVDDLVKTLSESIIQKSITFPWIFGRVLYDKYFNEFEDQQREINFDETKKLLNDTLTGVFQLGRFIVGPFGILVSDVCRRILSTSKFQLWHCPDPSCSSFHSVRLCSSRDDIFSKILASIAEINIDTALSEVVDAYFSMLSDKRDYFDAEGIPVTYEILVDAFGTNELRSLVAILLTKSNLREIGPTILKKGRPASIAQSLSKDQCFQILLLLNDKTLIENLEELIDNGVIYIPSTEIRESHVNEFYGSFDVYHQCNKLGIRSQSNRGDFSIVRFKDLLKKIYDEPNLIEQLEWQLRRYSIKGMPVEEKLEKYINETDPRTVVRELIMSGLKQLKKTFELLPGRFNVPESKDEEDRIIEKILWKVGFNINLYPSSLRKFWKQYSEFESAINSLSDIREVEMEKLTGMSANLFVSLEDLLEQALSYMTWVLLSDHYIDTKFRYVFEDARDFMVDQLDNFEYTNGEFLQLDKSGKNTLFPLITGFEVLAKVCEAILEQCTEKFARVDSEFPSFFNNTSLSTFPFLNKKFILDIRESDQQNVLKKLKEIPSELSRGNVLNIRNTLQHKREGFPAKKDFQKCLESVKICVSQLEEQNLFPCVFLLKETHKDKYDRIKISYEDYSGRIVEIYPSPEFMGIESPSSKDAQLIIPMIKLGETRHPVRFKYMEKSVYQQYWENYPLKKTVKLQSEKNSGASKEVECEVKSG
jgi:hypothetical protein